MKLVKFLLVVLLLSCNVGFFSAIKQREIQTPTINVDVDYKNVSQAAIRKAIVNACKECKWKVDSQKGNRIEASITVRNKHFVAVSIPYSKSSIRILYKKSSNMHYDNGGEKPKIHYQYNKWVNRLSQSIQMNLDKVSTRK